MGHYGRDCRINRYANRFTLPKAEKPANMNNIEKYCTYYKKKGHKRDECWLLNGRPEKEQPRRTKRDEGKGKQVNTIVKVGHLKGDTIIREKQLALTGVTGHKIYTLGKIKATVILGNREI